MTLTDTQRAVLEWIADYLHEKDITHQIVGGLAAKFYGSKRPLADIDFYVPDEELERIAEDLEEYVTQPPQRYEDEHWKITFMKLEKDGQKIEFGGSDDAHIYDSMAGRWVEQRIDYDASTKKLLDGTMIHVMPKGELIAYKKMLGREVDLQDVHEMKSL